MRNRGEAKGVWRAAVGLGIAALLVASAYGAADAVLADPPTAAGFADTVLASRAVVAAVRIAVTAAAAYVVASVIALVRRGQFLTRVGPVEASDEVAVLMAENADLQAALDGARAELRTYEKRYAELREST